MEEGDENSQIESLHVARVLGRVLWVAEAKMKRLI